MAFTNPTGLWKHDGAFSVELNADVDRGYIPVTDNLVLDGDIIRIQNGQVVQTAIRIELRFDDMYVLSWSYPFMKEIRDGDGNLLWKNPEHI